MKRQTTLLLIVFLLLGLNYTYSQNMKRAQGRKPTPGYIPVFDSGGDIKESKMYYPSSSTPYLPDTLLHVDSPISFHDTLFMTEDESYINLFAESKSARFSFIRKNRIYPQGKTLMTVADRNQIAVGIGTDTPSATLDVVGKTRTNEFAMESGASQGDILLSGDSEGTARWKDPSVIRFWEEKGSSQIVYAPGRHGAPGAVGINMLDPQYALDVDGTIHATDSITSPHLHSQSGLFTGNLSANTGDFSGDVEMNSHVKANALEVINNAQFNSNVTIDGTLSATTGDFTGTVVMNNLKTRADNILEIRQDNDAPIMTLEPDLVTIGHNYYGNTTDLKVGGKIFAEEVEVVQDVWSDYVFKEDYELRSLASLETYIRNHKKLPGIPSKEEVKEDGVNVSEMNAKLLEKIEGLTLYTLEQQKTIKKQHEDLQELKKELKELKNEK